jgi:hypothetical protein
MHPKHQANKTIHESESIAQMVENQSFQSEEKIRLSIFLSFISFELELIKTVLRKEFPHRQP